MNNHAAAASTLTRRTVAKLGLVGLAGVAVGAGTSAVVTRLGPSAPRPYRFLSATDAALLIEICEQIILHDDTPGATDAGVIQYIDRQLVGALARHQGTYRWTARWGTARWGQSVNC